MKQKGFLNLISYYLYNTVHFNNRIFYSVRRGYSLCKQLFFLLEQKPLRKKHRFNYCGGRELYEKADSARSDRRIQLTADSNTMGRDRIRRSDLTADYRTRSLIGRPLRQ